MKNYYEILNVSTSDSTEEIRRAFRQKAKKCHPDINRSPGAAERFRQVFEAYEILCNEERRRLYDENFSRHVNVTPVATSEVYMWQEQARQHADYYARTPYEDFVRTAVFEMKVAAKMAPKTIPLIAFGGWGVFLGVLMTPVLPIIGIIIIIGSFPYISIAISNYRKARMIAKK